MLYFHIEQTKGDSVLMEYKKKLKALREDNDYTQVEIAKILGTSQSYYAQYENKNRKLPIEHLIKLCEFYDVSADYILGLPEGLKYPKR